MGRDVARRAARAVCFGAPELVASRDARTAEHWGAGRCERRAATISARPRYDPRPYPTPCLSSLCLYLLSSIGLLRPCPPPPTTPSSCNSRFNNPKTLSYLPSPLTRTELLAAASARENPTRIAVGLPRQGPGLVAPGLGLGAVMYRSADEEADAIEQKQAHVTPFIIGFVEPNAFLVLVL